MKKRVKRKVWAKVNPIEHAISGARIVDETALNKLRMLELSSIDAFVRGKATIADWRAVVDMLNISEMMGRQGIGPEVLPHCQQATDSLHKAALRYEKTKKMGLDGLGLTAIKEIYEYHDMQRTSIARSVYEEMIEATRNYIRSKGKDIVEVV